MPRQKSGTFDQMEYIKQYNNQHIKYRKLSLNVSKEEDNRVLEWLDAQPDGISSYLKRLIQEDMQRRA